MNIHELTLLSEGQIWGNSNESQLDVMKKYGTRAAITDLCILTGSNLSTHGSWFWTKSADGNGIRVVNDSGNKDHESKYNREGIIRPVLQSSVIFPQVFPNRVREDDGTEEVEYGEYPQYAADSELQRILASEYVIDRLTKTGKSYTFDSVKDDDLLKIKSYNFRPVIYEEYEYQGKKYIRIKANFYYLQIGKFQLSNGVEYYDGDYVWVEVSPVKWLIDDRTGTLISKKGLLAGIRFLSPNQNYKGDFERTEMKEYLDQYMSKDLFHTTALTNIAAPTLEEKKREQQEKRRNPYGLTLETVSEEEIIKGAIESDVPVFLHGPSSEGKSARVKQIDPTCEIIYLRNATPDSLNGKSVYNQATGEMIDIKPTWLKKLEEKCQKEPDKQHIVFLDEITNALPSIQGIAFNIVLDREVNGIWKLPGNARIVAAGNDMKDSLAANPLAEPLFNRFAHVYIKTTTESWLKWASDNNIHPAIYSYIAYKNGETLRSEYDGEKPNADPRKWEMASKMLYATGNPEMLRALVGEDITREFVQFCNQQVITLDDVINECYTDRDTQVLNTAERYVTTMGLSQVDDDNLEKVRNFVANLGAEFLAIFDVLWTHGDESKLERLAEVKLGERQERGIRR